MELLLKVGNSNVGNWKSKRPFRPSEQTYRILGREKVVKMDGMCVPPQ